MKTKQQKEKLQRTGVLIVALLAAAGLGALLSNQFGEQQVDPKSEPQSVSDKGPSGESNDSRADIISGSSDGDEKSKEKPRDLETKKLLEDRHTEVRLGLSWDAEPNILRVYQSTEVRLRVKEKPAGHSDAQCEWFLDGTSKLGCNIVHVFEGGLADARVRLRLVDGEWSHDSTRIIPLERLEVVEGLERETLSSANIPEAKSGERSFRFTVISDSAAQGGVPSDVRSAVTALTNVVRPELVFHLGGIVVPQEGDLGWDKVNESIASPLRRANIKTLWGMSSTDTKEGARVRRPDFELIDGKNYPFRYTFSYKGAFFLCFSVDGVDGADEVTLRWLKATLEKAKIYDSRFVMTYLPLNKFTDMHVGSHKKKMRLYEILLRARVTALFTGAYRVYFKGRYGVLDVVSTGALASPGSKLAGTNLSQKSSFTVVDIYKGAMKKTFAIEGPEYNQVVDESLLPSSVEVYTR